MLINAAMRSRPQLSQPAVESKSREVFDQVEQLEHRKHSSETRDLKVGTSMRYHILACCEILGRSDLYQWSNDQ